MRLAEKKYSLISSSKDQKIANRKKSLTINYENKTKFFSENKIVVESFIQLKKENDRTSNNSNKSIKEISLTSKK